MTTDKPYLCRHDRTIDEHSCDDHRDHMWRAIAAEQASAREVEESKARANAAYLDRHGTPDGQEGTSEATGGETRVQSHTAVVRPVSGDSGVWPTPRQFVDRWERWTDAERLARAEWIIDNGQTASTCFVMNHEGLTAERDALRAEVEQARMAHGLAVMGAADLREQRDEYVRRAEVAEAVLAAVEALAEQWEAATVWPDRPHRQLRGAAARLRIALSGESEPTDD